MPRVERCSLSLSLGGSPGGSDFFSCSRGASVSNQGAASTMADLPRRSFRLRYDGMMFSGGFQGAPLRRSVARILPPENSVAGCKCGF
jgi:hypothetical protein